MHRGDLGGGRAHHCVWYVETNTSTLISIPSERFADRVCPEATLFQRLPDLKIAVREQELEFSPLHKDVGITYLPVTF